MLEELAASIKDSALCGLGQTAPNPVLSTLRYFRHEYEAHIYDKKCPACVCSGMFKSPCQHGCPIEMDIPGYIALVRANRLDDAYRLMKRTNPFPAVCGRICPQFCATKCRRSQLDESMAIAWLKRYVTDNARKPRVEAVPVTRAEKIAVIGAGPAGLTAAQDLAKRGYPVTVFEELPFTGGMLRYGIPEYRLSRQVIQAEINDIAALGVEIKTGCRVGRDIEYAKLKADYDIVVLATGAHKSWTLDIEGEDLAGVWGAVEFLREVNLGKPAKIGKRVAVIGGGNTAIDAARTAIRLGAGDVSILYRREKKDMPAWANEIEAAELEGVKIECLVNPVKFTGKAGKLTGVVCQRMRLGEFDRSGRRKAVPIEGDQFTRDFDCVIPAISQSGDASFLPSDAGVQITGNGTFKIKPKTKTCTADARVFAAGDAVLGPATVVEAIAMGHQAADEVDSFIRAKNNEQPWKAPAEDEIVIPFEVDEEPQPTPRGKMPELTAKERVASFKEVELGYTADIAWAEACRCQRCDGCNHE